MDFFVDYFDILSEKIKNVDTGMLRQAVEMIQLTSQNGGKTIIAGNGGSAAIASHVSVDLTKSAKIRAINFNEADLITCFANDYGYERWVEKALDSYANKGDICILISSSGKSKNIINAALKSKSMGLKTITFSGFGLDNPLRTIGDINFWVDSKEYNLVEITHQVWLLAIIEKAISERRRSI